jgi:hypothetical protein
MVVLIMGREVEYETGRGLQPLGTLSIDRNTDFMQPA